ncbi:LysR family transcriptional regulator [Streptomyces somaliensis]|uniref:LysR family transcriptional regulator n=1 Tax=Streptomyces somaliensis TaxID=78355 RepID=UPI0034E98282
MDLQFRHLRQLCVVSEAGSLNKAATVLGLPQPALSRQIRRLEELFGGTLFERDQHGTRPTPWAARSWTTRSPSSAPSTTSGSRCATTACCAAGPCGSAGRRATCSTNRS